MIRFNQCLQVIDGEMCGLFSWSPYFVLSFLSFGFGRLLQFHSWFLTANAV